MLPHGPPEPEGFSRLMPMWLQWVIGIGAGVTALAAIFKYVVRPLLKFGVAAEEMTPILLDLTETFRNTPHAFAVLDEIVAQVRTDSGSSLLDIVKRLEEAAVASHLINEKLLVSTEVSKEIADQDRRQLQELIKDLAKMSVRDEAVATDLAASRERAAGVESDEAGAAADAALQPGEDTGGRDS